MDLQMTPDNTPAMLAPLAGSLADLDAAVTGCTACPRLVHWRQDVAATRRAAWASWTYWGRAVPGFGDPDARIWVVGLAPAAHGANRTGRMFTGDRSGDWLFRALHTAGLASAPQSLAADDGLQLTGVRVTSAVHCAPPDNRPTPAERDCCAPWMQREFELLGNPAAVVALGQFAWVAVCRLLGITPRPRFGHGVEATTQGPVVVGSYHPSQQNTFTKRLTEPMLDDVFGRAVALAWPDR